MISSLAHAEQATGKDRDLRGRLALPGQHCSQGVGVPVGAVQRSPAQGGTGRR
jgi:hypothetical protein